MAVVVTRFRFEETVKRNPATYVIKEAARQKRKEIARWAFEGFQSTLQCQRRYGITSASRMRHLLRRGQRDLVADEPDTFRIDWRWYGDRYWRLFRLVEGS